MTYTYRCPNCGTFEATQKLSEDPIKKCPTCKSSVQKIIVPGTGIIFKGSGFHKTDYR